MDERRLIDLGIRLLFLGVFAFAAFTIILPLSGIVVWAIILAVAIYPLFDWLSAKLGGRRGWASTIITLLGLALTIGPLWASLSSFFAHFNDLSDKLQSGKLDLPPAPEGLSELTLVGPKATEIWNLFNNNLALALERYGDVVLGFASTVGGAVAGLSFQLLAMALSVIVMGMMLSPGPKLGDMVQKFGNRVFAPKGGEFVEMAAATVRNVSRGVLGVAAIQAGLMGVVMVLFGIDAAGPLAVVVLILGIIQVGPTIVVIPLVIWAWGSMGTGAALLFTAIMIPLMLMDNFLRPIFIAKGLNTPILVILVGVIGGVLSGGLIGIFVGPVILSVFYELVVAWMEADVAEEIEADAQALEDAAK